MQQLSRPRLTVQTSHLRPTTADELPSPSRSEALVARYDLLAGSQSPVGRARAAASLSLPVHHGRRVVGSVPAPSAHADRIGLVLFDAVGRQFLFTGSRRVLQDAQGELRAAFASAQHKPLLPIEVADIDSARRILKFMHGSKFDWNVQCRDIAAKFGFTAGVDVNVSALYTQAKSWGLDVLAQQCVSRVPDNDIRAATVFLQSFAGRHDPVLLRRLLINVTAQDRVTWLTLAIKKINATDLRNLLACDHIKMSEASLCNLLFRWAGGCDAASVDRLRQNNLLTCIRWQHLSSHHIDQLNAMRAFTADELARQLQPSNPEARDLVIDIEGFHTSEPLCDVAGPLSCAMSAPQQQGLRNPQISQHQLEQEIAQGYAYIAQYAPHFARYGMFS